MTDEQPEYPPIPRGFDAPLQGDHEMNRGVPTGLKCPNHKQCGGYIVYNGNYFCTEFGHDSTNDDGSPKRIGGDCDWALPHGDAEDGFNDKPETERFAKRCYRGLRNERIKAWRRQIDAERVKEAKRAARAAKKAAQQ